MVASAQSQDACRAAPRGRVQIEFDPIALVIEVFESLYPGKACKVAFGEEDEDEKLSPDHFGYTCFRPGELPLVVVNARTPYSDCVETLAHELAHVAVGIRGGHGRRWKAAFAAIHAAYCERMETLPGVGVDL